MGIQLKRFYSFADFCFYIQGFLKMINEVGKSGLCLLRIIKKEDVNFGVLIFYW